jgi:hypothetical protein
LPLTVAFAVGEEMDTVGAVLSGVVVGGAVTGAVPESFELDPMQPANETPQIARRSKCATRSGAFVLFVLFM